LSLTSDQSLSACAIFLFSSLHQLESIPNKFEIARRQNAGG
jgi:hypothetical protein